MRGGNKTNTIPRTIQNHQPQLDPGGGTGSQWCFRTPHNSLNHTHHRYHHFSCVSCAIKNAFLFYDTLNLTLRVNLNHTVHTDDVLFQHASPNLFFPWLCVHNHHIYKLYISPCVLLILNHHCSHQCAHQDHQVRKCDVSSL